MTTEPKYKQIYQNLKPYSRHLIALSLILVTLFLVYLISNRQVTSPEITVVSDTERLNTVVASVLVTQRELNTIQTENFEIIDQAKYNCEGCMQVTINLVPSDANKITKARITLENWQEINTELF